MLEECPIFGVKDRRKLQSSILTCAVHQILTRDKDIVFEKLLLIVSNCFVKCF